MNNFDPTPISSPEQESHTKQTSKWDSLTKVPEEENWDEHLEKANALINYNSEAEHQETNSDISERKIFEAQLNAALTKVNDLEKMSQIIFPDDSPWKDTVSKTEIRYQNQVIPVYKLSGYPLKFLSHSIDYGATKGINNEFGFGAKIREDPSIWAQRNIDISARETKFGARRGNTISMSYNNLEKNLSQYDAIPGKKLIYGFDHIRENSVLNTFAGGGDGRTSNLIGDEEKHHPANIRASFEDLQQPSLLDRGMRYNEVQTLRYDDQGNPLLPSFIITDRDDLSTDNSDDAIILKHANYFGIPIIQIDRSGYDRKLAKSAMSRIGQIDVKSDFEAINDAEKYLLENDILNTGSFGHFTEYHFGYDHGATKMHARNGDVHSQIPELEKLVTDFLNVDRQKRFEHIVSSILEGKNLEIKRTTEYGYPEIRVFEKTNDDRQEIQYTFAKPSKLPNAKDLDENATDEYYNYIDDLLTQKNEKI